MNNGKWQLPAGWEWATFDDVATVESNLVDPAENQDAPHIAPNHIESGSGRLLDYTTIAEDKVTSPKHLFYPGQILYSKIRPYLAKAVLVDFKGLCSADMYPVATLMNSAFLHQWLISPMFTAQTSGSQGRTVLPKINQKALAKLQVPVPPLPEQRRIVAKIEALQERSRKARAALEAIPPLLEQFRQSVLAAAFRGDLTADWRAQHPDVEPASVLLDRIRAERRRRWEEAELAKMQAKGKMPKDEKWKERYKEPEPVDETDLPELPEGWGWTTVEDVSAVVVDCPHSTPSWTEKGRICVRTTEFRPGYLDLNQVRFVSEVTYRKRIERLQPKQGDILYSREGGILGVACIISPRVELCLGQRMMLLRIEEKLSPRFVMHLLNSPLIQEKVRALTGGSASPHLNVGDVRKLPVPLPSPLEQEHIVRNIEEQLSATSEIGADVAENLELLDQLDQSILAKAFRGELVPQDPNDEPASVLLDRIRTEREAQSAKPRAKKKTLGSTKHTKKAPPVSVNENDDLPLFNNLQK